MREMMTGKGLKVVLLIVMLLFSSIVIVVPSMVRADTNGTYNYTVNGGQATITGYIGTDAAITIPSTLGTYPVVAIGNYAFTGLSSVLSVTIPSNINLIGNLAFYGCNNLASITVDGANTHYASSGGVLYSHDLTTLVSYPKAMTSSHFDIPDSVTTIADQAFFSVNHLTSVTIPDSVSSVGKEQFLLCSALTNIAVDIESPYYASSGGVLYSHDLTTLVMYPNGLTGATFTIPSTVTKICAYAFYGCRPTTVNIPNSVRSIGDHAFDQSALTSLTIPDSVTSMGNYTFYNINYITSVHIGNGATYVGDYAFYACGRLATVSIGTNAQTIGTDAFGQCSQMTSVTIPGSVTSIGDWAFSSCTALTSVTIGRNVTSIGSGAFSSCSALTSVTIGSGVTTIGDHAFYQCTSLTSVTIGRNVTSIGDAAFSFCVMTSVTIPDSVTSIGNYAFSACTALTSVTIPGHVTSIGSFAFSTCTALTSVTIVSGVTSIGPYVFYSCTALTSITIPGSVTSIGSFAFQGCSGLTSITFLGMVAPPSVQSNWITGTNAGIVGHAYAASNFPAPGNVFPAGQSRGANGLLMSPAALDHYYISSATPQVAGVGWTGSVTSKDAYNNTVTTDSSTVTMTNTGAALFYTTSSDVTVTTTYALSSGVANFYVKDTTAQTITLTATSTKTGTSGSIVIKPAAIDHFTMTGVPGSGTAGTAWTAGVVVTAYDAYNNIKTDYTGQVYFTSTSTTATLPYTSASEYTFTSGTGLDNGVHSFPGAGFTQFTTGSRTITITTGTVSLTSSAITVNPAAVSKYVVSSTTPQIAGVGWSGTITAEDQYNNIVTTDTATATMTGTGSVLFYTTSGYSTTTTSYVLSSGVATFYAMDTVAQTITLTATTSSITGTSSSITVTHAAATSLVLTPGTDSITAGTTQSYVATATDATGNTWDVTATTSFEINSHAAGSWTLNVYTAHIAGVAWVINGTDSVSGITAHATLTVTPAAIDHFTVTGITDPVVAGVLTSPTVTAYDTYGNIATGYTGTIHFTSTDVKVGTVLPDDYTFLSGDNGVHVFTSGVKLITIGEQTVTATDTSTSYITGFQTITVDTAVLTVTITAPISNSYNNTGIVTVVWNASDASGIAKTEISTDGTTWTNVTGTTNDTLVNLTDGSHTFYVRVTDVAGNMYSTSVTFIVDTVAPTVTSHSPTGSDVAINSTVSVTFSEAMNTSSVSIAINGVGQTWSGKTATFTQSSTLAYNTSYSVTVAGKDLAGNMMKYSWSFTTMKNEGMIEGAIKDADGNPIANATVTLSNGMTTMTDVKGHFSFENVPSGNYTMNTTKAGLKPITQSVSASAGQTNELGTLSASSSLESTPASNNNSDNNLPIVAGVLVVVAILLSLLLFVKRRKKQE
jgi:uncharacterized membrane protein